MSADLSGYTFTNGTKVTDWIATLPADDRERASKAVQEFVAERKPLNMLQVKIRMTAPAPDPAREFDDGERPASPPQPQSATSSSSMPNDAYNSPGPILPTIDPRPTEAPVKEKRNNHTLVKLIVIIASVILMIAIFTNPSRQTHVDTMTETVARATAKSLGQVQDIPQDIFGDMFGFTQPRFTDDVIESLVHDVLESELEYHNYILWSTCTALVGGHEQTVSVGAFGLVRPLDENLSLN